MVGLEFLCIESPPLLHPPDIILHEQFPCVLVLHPQPKAVLIMCTPKMNKHLRCNVRHVFFPSVASWRALIQRIKSWLSREPSKFPHSQCKYDDDFMLRLCQSGDMAQYSKKAWQTQVFVRNGWKHSANSSCSSALLESIGIEQSELCWTEDR